jgi:hypothetical protein
MKNRSSMKLLNSQHQRVGVGIFRLTLHDKPSKLRGICGVCGVTGDHEFFDVDLRDLVCLECRDDVRDAEIQCRACMV